MQQPTLPLSGVASTSEKFVGTSVLFPPINKFTKKYIVVAVIHDPYEKKPNKLKMLKPAFTLRERGEGGIQDI